MAIFLAAVNVYLRDVQHLIEVVVGSAWFWACPIVYSFAHIVSPKLSAHHIVWIYFLNPMTPIVMTFERVLYAKTGLVPLTTGAHTPVLLLPPWGPLTYVELDAAVLGASLLFLYLAMLVFGRLAGNFAEEL
jgi:ABC-2 type transport system permease protein